MQESRNWRRDCTSILWQSAGSLYYRHLLPALCHNILVQSLRQFRLSCIYKRDIVVLYRQAGYDAIVITDHFNNYVLEQYK